MSFIKQLAIGVDIGGTRTKIGLVDTNASKVLETLIYTTETANEQAFLDAINQAIALFKISAIRHDGQISGIGFGIPGFVFCDGKIDSTYGFIDFMEDYPLKQIIETKHQLPCRMDNDARVVALGEAKYGAGAEHHRVLVLTLGTGLGIGFIKDKKLNEALPYAHMAGHMSIIHNDIICYCGKAGCLESLVSATGLCRSAVRIKWQKNSGELPLTAENIFISRAEGNQGAMLLVEDLIGHLKTGIDNYINIYAPDIIILGSGMAKGLKNDLHKLHDTHLLAPFKKYETQLTISQLHEDAGILGSAALFNDNITYN